MFKLFQIQLKLNSAEEIRQMASVEEASLGVPEK